jgi:cytochrome P450
MGRDPLGFLTRCAREYGDFVPLQFGFRRGVLLNHPDYIEYVLVTNQRNFVKSPAVRRLHVLGNGLLSSEGEFWRRQRRLIQPAFHRQRIAEYGQVMVSLTEQQLAGANGTGIWRDGEVRDVAQEMMALTTAIVTRTLFGADVPARAEDIATALREIGEHFNSRLYSLRYWLPDSVPTPGNRRLHRAVRQLDAIIYHLIEQRRRELAAGNAGTDRGDLLSMLVQVRDEDDGSRMSDKQLRDEVMTLFLAGQDTTALALSWTWYLLSQHPEAEATLHTEIEQVLGGRAPVVADLPRLRYAEMVIMESMRLYPPAWTIGREAVGDCEIGGHHVPAGTILTISQWVMHRDPRYFEHPDSFRPERWKEDPSSGPALPLAKRLPRFAYFPFGGGPRICIGNAFAMMEAVLLLATIAQQFRLRLMPNPPVVPQPYVTLRPKYGLPMALQRR